MKKMSTDADRLNFLKRVSRTGKVASKAEKQ